MPPRAELMASVQRVLDDVVDPCSVGRGVSAGLRDMGMVLHTGLVTRDGRTRVEVVLRLTSPGCTFQLLFDDRVRAALSSLDGVDEVAIEWSDRFDWSDDDMSSELKQRLRDKRARLAAVRA